MKDTLLRPTSTASQVGSVISENDIRRRGNVKHYIYLFIRLFSSNDTIIIN